MHRPAALALVLLCTVALGAPASRAEAPAASYDGLWHWRTIVVDGPKALRGVVGRYEAIIATEAGNTSLAVAKTGYGKTDYPSGKTPVAVVSGLAVAPGDDGVAVVDTTVSLVGGSTRQPMAIRLRFVGDHVYGTWRYLPDGRTRGVLIGVRAPGAPPSLTQVTAVPCAVCCDLRYDCGEQGPGACNSSQSCLDACAEKGQNATEACLTPAE